MNTGEEFSLGFHRERSIRRGGHLAVMRPFRCTAVRCLSWGVMVAGLAVFPAAAVKADQPAKARPASIPLTLEQAVEPGASAAGQADGPTDRGPLSFDWQAWAVVALAVAGMLGLRFFGRQRTQPLPTDVFELLGEATLGGGQPVRIVRFGPKTLLVTTGSGGPRTLAELDDPLATEWIAAACRGDRTLRAVHPPAGRVDPVNGRDARRSTAGSSSSGPESLEPSLQSAEVA